METSLGSWKLFLILIHSSKSTLQTKRKPSNISSTVCNKFIDVEKDVQKHIVTELADSKYHSLIVDSAPDVSHIDQLLWCFSPESAESSSALCE
jgi:hypothetical protein